MVAGAAVLRFTVTILESGHPSREASLGSTLLDTTLCQSLTVALDANAYKVTHTNLQMGWWPFW
jgi:hypothetical protein